MQLDFSDPARQAALKKAAGLVTQAYEILAKEVGAPNPSDNAFLREAMICAEAGLVWQGDRGGVDAIDPVTKDEVELKSTKLDGKSIEFPTSRAISPTVIKRFRASGHWLFAVFDNHSNLAIVYRLDAKHMAAKVDALEAKMHAQTASASGKLENNPKTSLNSIRADCRVIFKSPNFEKYETKPGRWRIRRVGS